MKKNQNNKTKINNEKLFRTASFEKRSIDEQSRTVELAFSSEEPYERFFGIEILDHSEGSVDLEFISSGNAPLLLDHDTTKQIGVIESAEVSPDRKARAKVRFGKGALASEIFEDIVDGIRRNVSVGYRINKFVIERDDEDDETDTYRVTDWTPFEASIVSIPADTTVGVGRDAEFEEKEFNQDIKRNNIMSETKTEGGATDNSVDLDKIKQEAKREAESAVKAEKDRVAEIMKLANRFKMSEQAQRAIEDGKSAEDFTKVVLDNVEQRSSSVSIKATAPIDNGPVTELGMDNKDLNNYSFLRAVRASMTGNWSNAGLEQEASREVEKKLGRETNGFFVPYDWQTRTLTAGTATAGAELVGTDHMGGNFIEALRKKLRVRALGATMLSGLQGNVSIPKQVGKSQAAWGAEGTAASESDATTGEVNLSPNQLSANTSYSRRLLLQSDPSVENMIMNDLATEMAIAIDFAAIAGTGTGDQPRGILNTPGIGAGLDLGTNGGAPTWELVHKLVEQVQSADAGDTGAFLSNPAVQFTLMTTPKESSALVDSVKIMTEPDNLASYPFMATTNVPNDLVKGASGATLSALIYAHWPELIVAEWGVLEILVDGMTLSTSGRTRVTSITEIDVAVKHAEAFAASQEIETL